MCKDNIDVVFGEGAPPTKWEGAGGVHACRIPGSETGLDYSKKKNRVIFPKEGRLLKLFGIQEQKTRKG